MRALFLNQFYAPDIAATAQVLSALCQDLAAAGHDIAVLCSGARYRQPHHGHTESHQASDPPFSAHEVRAGVHVHRVPLPPSRDGALSPRRQLMQRLRREAEFSIAALRALHTLLKHQPADVVVAMSTPPTLLFLALCGALPRRIPVVYWVQDVYPDVLVASGLLKPQRLGHRLLLSGLTQLVQALYRHTAAAIVLDEAMRERLLASGFPADRLHVIEHAADPRAIAAIPARDNRLRTLVGLREDDFVLCYAGNLGRGHDFATLAAAWPQVQSDPSLAPVHFLFIGDGEQRAFLAASVPPALRHRVHFLPPQEAALRNDLLSAGDVALVTLGADFAGLMTPSKVYPLLAAARPILYIGPAAGRLAQLCQPSPGTIAVGERVKNGDVAGLLAALHRLVSDRARLAAMGQKARHLAETRFDQRLTSAAHAALLYALAHQAGRSP